jgi:hypothetical protein
VAVTPVDDLRVFRPKVQYNSFGWFAEVWADGASAAYMKRARITRWGASLVARRLARKLNRLERKGLLA